jgi:glycosyltransferase involved in cell wall biosynthesis
VISHPKVSIVIPVFNGADFLRQAVESALNQTYPRVEVIVVNDGSIDGGKTEEIAKSFGSRIRYVHRPNGGVAAALNTGIQMMEGDFFSWRSHDDLYYPHKIEFQLKFLKDALPQAVMLYSDFDIIDANSICTGVCRVPSVIADAPLVAILSTIVHGCSTLVSREIFDRVGLFNERLLTTQDNDMWLRILKDGYPILHVPEVLIRSRQHAGQGQRKLSDVNRSEIAAFFRKVAEEFGDRSVHIIKGGIQSDYVFPFSFVWVLWTRRPFMPPSGWVRYLCRCIYNALRWQFHRSVIR